MPVLVHTSMLCKSTCRSRLRQNRYVYLVDAAKGRYFQMQQVIPQQQPGSRDDYHCMMAHWENGMMEERYVR